MTNETAYRLRMIAADRQSAYDARDARREDDRVARLRRRGFYLANTATGRAHQERSRVLRSAATEAAERWSNGTGTWDEAAAACRAMADHGREIDADLARWIAESVG